MPSGWCHVKNKFFHRVSSPWNDEQLSVAKGHPYFHECVKFNDIWTKNKHFRTVFRRITTSLVLGVRKARQCEDIIFLLNYAKHIHMQLCHILWHFSQKQIFYDGIFRVDWYCRKKCIRAIYKKLQFWENYPPKM